MDALDKFRTKFLEEATDLIGSLEQAVLELEQAPSDADIVQRIFRVMHTLKGNSSMFGFSQVDRFTHHMETIYDLVRSGDRKVDKDILDMTFKSVDHLRALLKEAGSESEALMRQQDALMASMDAIISGKPVPQAAQ